jgi:hypothetical protein
MVRPRRSSENGAETINRWLHEVPEWTGVAEQELLGHGLTAMNRTP